MPTILDQNRAIARDKMIRLRERINFLYQIADDSGQLAALKAVIAAAGLPSEFDSQIDQLTEGEFILEAILLNTEKFFFDNGLYGGGSAVGDGLQDIAELTLLGPSDREDKQMRLVEDEGWTYRFDAESTADPADDGVEIPDDLSHPADPGRWIKIEVTEASEVGFDDSTANLGTSNLQNAVEALAVTGRDAYLYVDADTQTEAEIVTAINDMKTSMAATITAKGYAVVELDGKISWKTQGQEPDPCDNIIFVKTDNFIFEFPSDMDTGEYTTAYFRGRNCTLTGGMGKILTPAGISTATRRAIWEGDQSGVCEGWEQFPNGFSNTADLYPQVFFNAIGQDCTIRNIHKRPTSVDLTINAVTDAGGFARFNYDEGPFGGGAYRWVDEGSLLIVSGSTHYNGVHRVTGVSATGQYITTATAWTNPDTGTAVYRGINREIQALRVGYPDSPFIATGYGLNVENLSYVREILFSGADSVVRNIRGAAELRAELGSDDSTVSGVYGNSTLVTHVDLNGDRCSVEGYNAEGRIEVNGTQCRVTGVQDFVNDGNALIVNGADAYIGDVVYSSYGAGCRFLADDIHVSNMRGNLLIEVNGDRLRIANSRCRGLYATGESIGCRIEALLYGEISGVSYEPDLSNFVNSKFDLTTQIWGNTYRIGSIKGFGKGNTFKWHMKTRTNRDDGDRIRLWFTGNNPDGNGTDGDTFEITWDTGSLTYEVDFSGTHPPSGGGIEYIDVSAHAGDNAAIMQAIGEAISNSVAPFEAGISGATYLRLAATRFIAMWPSDTNPAGNVVSIADTTGSSSWLTINSQGTGSPVEDLCYVHNCEDCDFEISVPSRPGINSDYEKVVVAAILDTAIGGSVKVVPYELNAEDEPAVVCLSPSVDYKIVNPKGKVFMGYELGSVGKITFTGLGGGSSIDTLNVAAVDILTGPVSWNTDLDTTMDDLVADINSNSGVSGYRAERSPEDSIGVIKIFEVIADETSNDALTATFTGGGAYTSINIKGGVELGLTKALLNTTAKDLHFSDNATANPTTKVAGIAVLENASTGNTVNNSVTEVS